MGFLEAVLFTVYDFMFMGEGLLCFSFSNLLVKNFYLQAAVVNIWPPLLCLSLHIYVLIFRPLLLLSLVSVQQLSSTEYREVCRSSGCRRLASVQFSSVAQSCPTLFDPMNRSTPGLPVHHHLLEFTQTHVHRIGDAIQPSHPLSSPSPPVPNPSQHQSLFPVSQLFS